MQNKKIISIFQSAFAYVFTFLVIGGFGSWFLFQQAKSEEARLELTKNDYNNTLKQLESFDGVKSDFDDSVSLRDQMANLMITPDGTLGLIEELENAAKLSNVTLKTNIGDDPSSKNAPKIGQTKLGNANNSNKDVWLELLVEGSYSNTLQFIRYLENAKRLIAVSTVSIGQAGNLSPDEVLNSSEGTLGNLKSKILVSNVFVATKSK